MIYAKLFFLEIVGPLIVLALYAYFVPQGVRGLMQAWKAKNKSHIWGYSWGLLAFLYFFLLMVKRCN
jgi:hypothetical protein